MKPVLAAVGALLASLESSAQPLGPKQEILPADAAAAIEQTPCPDAAQISVEACLLWLSPPRQVETSVRGRGKGAASGAAAFATGLWGAPEPTPEAELAPPQDPPPQP
jgi:hypothetical protein